MQRLKNEFVRLEDIQLAFCQHGEGDDLLLLHGNSGSNKFFKDYQLDHFADHHTIAIDSRGHGKSRSKDSSLTYEQLSLDILNFCKAKNIQQTSVIGYSDGGNLGLWLAIKAPEIFTRVVAISPNTHASGTTPEAMCAIQGFIKRMTRLGRFGWPIKRKLMSFSLMLTDTGITDADLQSIRTSVLIVYAEKDMIKEDHLQHIVDQIPGAQRVKIDNCNHFTIPFQMQTISVMKEYLENGQVGKDK
jgi:pimeloyl-ACP methyl ester carboxylesterase